MTHMKKTLIFLLVSVMLLSFPTTAKAAESSGSDINVNTELSLDNSIVTPNAWYYSKQVTIIRYYTVSGDIPQTYYYTEYDSKMEVELGGVLTRQSTQITYDGLYKVTFVGTIGTYIF